VFRQGDTATSVFVLTVGQVKMVHMRPDGQAVLARHITPGEVFGGIAMLDTTEYPATAEAVSDCEMLAWDHQAMRRLLREVPAVAINTIHWMAGRIKELQNQLAEQATEQVERRIARAVLRLVRQAGRQVNGGVLIDLQLSRQDIAETCGTTLYTVSRTFSRWKKQGIIDAGRTRLVVLRPHILVTIAEDLPVPPGQGG